MRKNILFSFFAKISDKKLTEKGSAKFYIHEVKIMRLMIIKSKFVEALKANSIFSAVLTGALLLIFIICVFGTFPALEVEILRQLGLMAVWICLTTFSMTLMFAMFKDRAKYSFWKSINEE